MIESIQLRDENSKCILVKTIEYGSMCSEFDPGPSEDDPFPEYYNTSVEVTLVDLQKNTVEPLNSKQMKELYKQIMGRNERISYFYLMKYIAHKETFGGTGDCNPI